MQHLDDGTIHAWLDGALPPDEARAAEAHVADCDLCSTAVAEARGLIAAASMILSKLDDVGIGAAGSEQEMPAGVTPLAGRTAATPRQPVVRRWGSGFPLKAAATLLIVVGGGAAVARVVDRGDISKIVAESAIEADAVAGDGMAEASARAAEDATAAATEQVAPVAPPPPTVGPAPHLPRPTGPAPRIGSTSAAPRPGRPGSRTELAGVGAVGDAVTAGAASGNLAGVPAPLALGTVRSPAEPIAEQSMAEAAKAAPPPAVQAAEVRTDVSPTAARAARRDSAGDRLTAAPYIDRRQQAPASQRMALAAPAPIVASSLVRACYVLDLSPWEPTGGAVPGAPPTRIVLSTDTGTVGPSKGQRLVRPMVDAFEGSHAAGWWTEVSPSTLVLTWATGGEGIVMRLVRSGEMLAGTARTFGAEGGVERASRVTGSLVECGPAR